VAETSGVLFEVAVFPAPKATATENQGLAFRLVGVPSGTITLPIPGNLQLSLAVNAALDLGIGLVLYPDRPTVLVGGLSSTPGPLATGGVDITLSRIAADSPIVIFDTGIGSTLIANGYHARLGLQASPSDVLIAAGIDGGTLSISLASADGFITSVVPSSAITIAFSLEIGWSKAKGIFVTGAGGIKTNIPVHATLGPVTIDSLDLAFLLASDGLTLQGGVTAGIALGPIAATVQGIGASAKVAFKTGNMGPMDLSAAFLPPTGIGITVNAGAVSGGGFLSFADPRYSGAVELSVYGIAVKAFGLLDTKLPDGSSGYSFAIVISAEFTPIQLGFGFTLIGVGGLIGINRSLNDDGLSSAVRSGSLDNILFPADVVHDAPSIINDLATIFPAAPGHYVLGPMAKFGWGTPTLIDAELGIVLELPGPRLAVLGIVEMALPTKDAALLSIHLAIAGVFDFPKKLVAIDASLYDSQVVGFQISGDMAFRLSFGDQPNFALAVGGFNPVYQPPPGFPDLKRVTVDLGINGNPSLTLQGYFALTSNTAQVGAALDLYASGAGITLRGHLGFDALFIFSPFSFEADFSAGVSVSFAGASLGIGLHGSISGPTPWHVQAQVCVSVLFFDACLPVDISFGTNTRADLPPMDPWLGNPTDPVQSNRVIGLQDAIRDPNNWSGSFPAGAHPVVTLTQAATSGTPPVDPVGQAALHQKVCPLGYQLTKFGIYKPAGHTIFNIASVSPIDPATQQPVIDPSTGQPVDLQPRTEVDDQFAPALFTDLSDADKLSAPPYQPFAAGFTIKPDTVATGDLQSAQITYDSEVINNTDFPFTFRHLTGMATRSPSALGGIRRSGTQRFVDPTTPTKAVLAPELFVIADAQSLAKNLTLTNGAPVVQASAKNFLDSHVANQPSDVGQFRVVPIYLAA
jgi:hypothetical protein